MKKLYLLSLTCLLSIAVSAQTTVVTIFCDSVAYGTGNSTATVRTNNTMQFTSTTKRAYAVFDLSSIPAGTVIDSCEIGFRVTGYTPAAGAAPTVHNTYGYAGNLASVTTAAALFPDLTTPDATLLTNQAYTTGTGNRLLATTVAMQNFMSANTGDTVSIAWTGGSTHTYTIHGWMAGVPTVSTATTRPWIALKYCNGVTGVSASVTPTPICPGDTLTLSGNAGTGTTSYSWAGPGGFTSSALDTQIVAVAGVYTFTAYNSGGCGTNIMNTVTLNAVPTAVTASVTPTTLCSGSTITLTGHATVTGTPVYSWVGPGGFSATTLSATDVTNDLSSGIYTFTATNGVGCSVSATTASINVIISPAPITGASSICYGDITSDTTTLSDATGIGVWSIAPTSIATISATGQVTAISPAGGVATVSYGCGTSATFPITINPMPSPITGVDSVCQGSYDNLYSLPPVSGGVWSSSLTSIATVDAVTGIVYGENPGSAIISYTNPATTCYTTYPMLVNPLPLSSPVTGTLHECAGLTTMLSDVAPGGTWESLDPSIASISTSGLVTGIHGGTTTILYANGCGTSSAIDTVYSLPAPIAGDFSACIGSLYLLTDDTIGGSWSITGPGSASIASISPSATGGGVVTPMTAGTVTVVYTLPTTCLVTATEMVNAAPTVYSVTGGGPYCAGYPGIAVGLSGSDAIDVIYQLYYGVSLVDTPFPCTTAPINFGLQTLAGTYTVLATNTLSGCASIMAGSATVSIDSVFTNDSVTLATGAMDSVCNGTAVTYVANPVGGGTSPSYQWSVNGTPVAGVTSDTYTYTPANGDVVNCIMTSSYLCPIPLTTAYSTLMTVQPYGTPSVVTSYTPDSIICSGSPATFMTWPSFGGSTPVYSWLVNDTVRGTGSTFTYDPSDGDIVSCILYSDYGCRLVDSANSNKDTMDVLPLIVPSFTILALPGSTVNIGDDVTLIALLTNGGSNPTYQWYINGVAFPGETTDTFFYNDFVSGDSVSCAIINSGTCAEITTYNWVIISEYPLGVQQVGLPTADVHIAPNPNNGSFTLTGTWDVANNDDISMEITNMLGQVVYKNNIKALQGKINEPVSVDNKLPNGVYLLNLRQGDVSKVIRFVVE